MTKMKTKLILIIACISMFQVTILAQQECRDVLMKANTLYESGKVDECISTLEPCVKTLETKEESFEGYKLLAIASHGLGYMDNANYYIREMLSFQPDYQKYPNGDPSAFTKEVAKYQVRPKLSLGLKVGSSLNSSRLVQSYSALNELQRYKNTIGYQFGVCGSYLLPSDLSLRCSILIGGTGVEHEIESEGIWSKNYTENIQFFTVNIGVKKDFGINKKVDVFGGLDAGLMLLNSSFVTVTSLVNSPESFKVDTKNAIDERNKLQPHLGLVAGLSYELERGKFDVEIGYNLFFTNTVIGSERMSDIDFIFDSQYINDDLKLGLYTLNLVYTLPLNYRINK